MEAVAVSGPFFRQSPDGDPAATRFCFLRVPSPGVAVRGAVLAVHAFAEEMNKTRAAAADGARALAAAGWAVLQVDLGGCGDSGGEFEDATWTGWLADLDHAWRWLVAEIPGPHWLWGTRLGALLAEEFAAGCSPACDGLVFWQPVVNGAQHLGQFLRLKTVGSLLKDAKVDGRIDGAVARVAQPSPRADLASGHSIEVAGYRLTPTLADAIENARLGACDGIDARVPARIRWFEVSSQPQPTISPIATRIAERWRGAGSDVVVATVAGNAFWQTQEIERCPALVAATVAALDG